MARFSKRSLEGEFMIDHRASPGLTSEQLAGFDAPAVHGGDIYESAMVTCSHCRAGIVLNPQRTRERGYCPKCDKYLCDGCTFLYTRTSECRDFERQLEQFNRDIAQEPNIVLRILTQKGSVHGE